MGWDWEKTLSDVGESLADVIKLKYETEYGLKYAQEAQSLVQKTAQEAQPLVQKTFSGIVVPLIILFIIGIVVLRWKP